MAERADRSLINVVHTDGRFVGGEARALVRGLDGGPAVPPGRREHPTATGTLVANAETFAQTAVLLRRGARAFAETGTRAEPGTVLLTVGGAVDRPGVVEVPLGTPLGILLTAAQAAPATAVVTGGYHGSWLPPNPEIRLSRAGLAAAGGEPRRRCRLRRGRHDLRARRAGPGCRLAGRRVGQAVRARAASGCRPWLHRRQPRSPPSHPAGVEFAAFAHAWAVDGRGACSHPDGTVRFVTSALHLLRNEVEAHHRGGCGRPVLGRLPIGGTR